MAIASKAGRAAPSTTGDPITAPDSPITQLSNPFDFAKQVIETVKLIQSSDCKEILPVAGPQSESIAKAPESIIQASRLEVKEVHEVSVLGDVQICFPD